MKKISLPQKIERKNGEKENEGIITIEPCYPGYGTTIGNALRRVLLSSLPGAAVVGVEIKGATHEFTNVPHVKEDVLEIILNIKRLRLKVFSEEVVKLELDIHGEKEVKAKDIIKNSAVEIANPDLVIANITDMSGSLNIKIFVAQGIGYETIESREEGSRETGYIKIDSLFSPVSSVGLNIENVRVGKMTNWEKLSLNILTDGTITPAEAFKGAVEILIDQFSSLIAEEKPKKTKEQEETAEEIVVKEEIKKDSEEETSKKKRGRPKKAE